MTVDSESEPFKGYNNMVNIVGKRHAKCWFDNYDVGQDQHTPLRSFAVQAAKDFAMALRDEKGNGRNIIFLGDCGTGKDHLAVSILRVALSLRLGARYRRGSVLCNECRTNMLEKTNDVPHDMWSVDLLVISDIEPHAVIPASDWEQRALLELIDRRYTAMLPTVVTTNKKNRQELIDSIGKRSVDRLFEGADVIPMRWQSYRETAK